ncbi:MAG TPA: cytochrome c-type biogenesis protein CcmH [Gemmatimonadales bacterium]|nr:cytochrome c-type biogenesis protein CcmH [Gemmatimonadales bacterium]
MSASLTRRELLRRSLIAATLVPLANRSSAQTPGTKPAADTGSADPLYRPDVVQQRGAASASDNDPVVKDLEHRLKCTCGCNLDIYTCRTTDFTCTYSPALHQEVVTLRSAGQAPDEVVASFVAKYGEQILMAPPPRGFNLAGYLVPGILVTLVGSLLAAVLIQRSRRITEAAVTGPSGNPPTQGPISADDRERLRRALSDVQD